MSTRSPLDSPHRFTITGTVQRAHAGAYRSSTASMPGFCSPTPTSSPAATPAIRGPAFPARGLSVVPRVTSPPSRARSTSSATSVP